ncbi:hypothetical protein OIU76_019390 [Salix suchowensis]|nr:hypothetical protein OIU76_019390 [Salix suchowensis]
MDFKVMDRLVYCVSVELWSTRKVEAEMADFGFMRIVDFKMIGSFVNARIWCDLLQLWLVETYSMEVSNELAIKKPKRLTSVVWNHFQRIRKADVCYAVCVHCDKKLSGSSNSGTTHLRNHLLRCLKRSNYDVSQLLVAKKKKKDTSLSLANVNASYDEAQRKDEYFKPTVMKSDLEQRKDEVISLGSCRFDQERSQLDLARMIILHGYPLTMVEHVGFKIFVKNLQPLFEFVPNSSIEVSCMEFYLKEKQKVYEMINRLHGRINLAIEMWSSPENAEYMCLIAHYIDEDWKLQQKILNFVTLDSSHTEDVLSEVIINCLMEWDVECKLFAMTFDECSDDDDIVLRIKDRISQDRPLLSNGQLFDVRSAMHVLNLIVQDAMETLREVTEKVRASVSYVKSSQVIQGKFNDIAQQIGISSQRNLVLDSSTRWNSTYFMLETVIGYKSAFCFLQEHDPAYTSALSDIEWEWARSITVDQGSALPGSSLPNASTDSRDRLKGFDKFLYESSQSQSAISDLDKYLEEPVFPRNCDFNILNWWKVHTPRYPILSMMARDILGTPMSTVSQELAFGVGGRVLDSYRSSLNPDTRQALICARDWLQVESEDHSSSSALALYVDAN